MWIEAVRRTRRRRPSLLLVAGLSVASLACAPPSFAAEPVRFALTGDPAELTRLSAEVVTDPASPAQHLLEESLWRLEQDGTFFRAVRSVYRIESSDRHPAWDEVRERWSPWRQARPLLEAQVVMPDGSVQRLDASTISESPVSDDQPNVFSDDREVHAPLPGLSVGCIVEVVISVSDTLAIMDSGRVIEETWWSFVPVHRRRLVVDLPDGAEFRHRIEKLDGVEVERTSAAGRTRVTFRAARLPAARFPVAALPPDLPRVPAVVFSTGRSWTRVAAAYHALVESRLATDPDRARVAAFAADAAGPARASLRPGELLERVVRRLHREVRYTGVAFGEASLLPTHPSRTLSRRYGDCKDKSLLLVAILRELGIPAEMALLRSGPGRDLVADLPGWGVFNHAIVRVGDADITWIDATAEFLRPGQLPFGVLGRQALPIGPASPGLVRTPRGDASDNQRIETREILLADLALGRVVETSDFEGVPEAEARIMFGLPPRARLEEQMTGYARAALSARGRVRSRVTDPYDFTRPFQLVIEAEDVESAETGLEFAVVGADRNQALRSLPEELLAFDADSLGDPLYTGHRADDFQILAPTTFEWRYRIVPARGFHPDPLPPAVEEDLGPYRFREAFVADSNGVVTGGFRLALDRDRMTAAEVLAFRRSLLGLLERPMPVIVFRHRGLALAAEGRVTEAIEALREEVKRDPAKPATHMRLANALLGLALGEAARSEARTAVGLTPSLALAHQNLGEVLMRDLFGRPGRPGFDQAGAIAAFRRAIALDTGLVLSRLNLALTLEKSAQADTAPPAGQLAEALEIYRSMPPERLIEHGVFANFLLALLAAGRFDEIERQTLRRESPGYSLSFRLAAIAASRGGDVAVAEATRTRTDDETRSAALLAAAAEIVRLGRYRDAATMTRAASRGRQEASALLAHAAMLDRMRPWDSVGEGDDDPRSVVFRLLRLMTEGAAAPESLRALSSREVGELYGGADDPDSIAATLRPLVRMLRSSRLPPRVMLELTAAQLALRVEGDPAVGCRVSAVLENGTGMGAFYTVRENGRWVITEFTPSGVPVGLALRALRALDARDTTAARQWLDWLRDALPWAPPDSTRLSPFFIFYPEAGSPRAPRMELAAATVLAAGGRHAARFALAVCDTVHPARLDPAGAGAFRWIHAAARIAAGHAEAAQPLLRELAATHPGSSLLLDLEVAACEQRRDLAAARRLVATRLARDPSNEPALHYRLFFGELDGDSAEVGDAGRRLEQLQAINAGELNNWAWFDLVQGTVSKATLDRIHRAVQEQDGPSPEALHTLAAIYAELGQTGEARDILLQYAEIRSLDEPDDSAWFVIGRIAEQHGLFEAARTAYRKVPRSTREFGAPSSMWLLAERRLGGLGR